MSSDAPPSLGRRFLKASLALACGGVTGVILGTIFLLAPEDIHDLATGTHPPISIASQILFGLEVGSIYALAVCLVAPVFWRILKRVGRDGWIAAAVLGFVLPYVFWSISEFQADAYEVHRLIGALPLGLAGAIAGLVTRWMGYRVGRRGV